MELNNIIKDYSLFLLKPDVLLGGKEWEVLEALSSKGFRLRMVRKRSLTLQEVGVLFASSTREPFYQALKEYMLSGPVIFGIVTGRNVVYSLNDYVGVADPSLCASGTLRSRFGESTLRNSIHSSNAKRVDIEIKTLYAIEEHQYSSFLKALLTN